MFYATEHLVYRFSSLGQKMAESNDNGDSWLSGWENQTMRAWEENQSSSDDMADSHSQKLWLLFQNSAIATSRLYKESCQGGSITLWGPFRNAASSVTCLYKEGVESMRKSYEHGLQTGVSRRNREIMSWIRKRKGRHIGREELIGYLCGKNPPMRSRPSPRLLHPAPALLAESKDAQEPDLQPFREALTLQRLNGAMSNISVGRTGQAPDSPSRAEEDFNRFVIEEISRRSDCRKRNSTSAQDSRNDSPSRKRNRLI